MNEVIIYTIIGWIAFIAGLVLATGYNYNAAMVLIAVAIWFRQLAQEAKIALWLSAMTVKVR